MSTATPERQPEVIEAGEWLLKDAAAKFLNTNIRSIERRAKRGEIASKYLPRRPSETQARVVYKKSDLDLILKCAEMPAIDRVTKKQTENGLAIMPSPALTGAVVAQTDFFAGLSAHLARLSAALPPAPPITKAWLTLEEAVEYSGLAAPELKRLLREGLIYSFGTGPKTWRIQRASLDAYGQAAHQ
jgi:hypothetical protein